MTSQAFYDEIDEMRFNATKDPATCRCHGGGWMLSDFDSWHMCPAHYEGQEHPETACQRMQDEEWEREHPEEAKAWEDEKARLRTEEIAEAEAEANRAKENPNDSNDPFWNQ